VLANQLPRLEQAMLTANGFYDDVLIPNVQAQHAENDSLRHAVNAIAALDYYVGIWCHELTFAGRTGLKEEAFRDMFAARSPDYQILRDMAFALKHGELTSKKVRMIRRPDQLEMQSPAFDPAVFDPAAFQTTGVACIQVTGDSSRAIWELLDRTMLVLTDLKNEFEPSP
jgi:hypothetical protein